MRGRWAWLLCAVSACGGAGSTPTPQPGGETFVDGTRLKARWLQPPGLPRRFAGWYDTQLGEVCQYSFAYWMTNIQRPVDATTTCLPSFASSDGVLFADAACTQPVVDVPCDAVHYVTLPPAANGDSCTEPLPLYPIGAPVTTQVLHSSTGGCHLLAPGDIQTPVSPHLVGAQVPLTSLVTAQVQIGSGPGRILPLTFKGSDGSSNVDDTRAWDTLRLESVTAPDWIAQPNGTPGKWEPSWIAVLSEAVGAPFSDPSCATSAAAIATCGDLTVRTIVEPGLPGCPPLIPTTYHDAGAKLDLGTIYVDDGNASNCRLAQASDLMPNQETVALGAAVPTSAFADVAAFEQGTGQVHLRQAGNFAGPVGYGSTYYDTTWQTACEPMVAADGVLRCLRSVFASYAYGDSGCTVPILIDDSQPTSCPATSVPPVITVEQALSSNACGVTSKFREIAITGIHAGSVYQGGPGLCLVQPIPPGSSYDIGAEVPPDQFVALATSTNPPY